MKKLDIYLNWSQEIVVLGLILLFAVCFIIFIKQFIIPTTRSLIDRFFPTYLPIFEEDKFFRYLLHSCFALYCLFWSKLCYLTESKTSLFNRIQHIIVGVYATIAITLFLVVLSNVINKIYSARAVARKLPIDLHTQIFKIFIVICAIIIVISYIFNISLAYLITSLGATTALLTFLFQDTVQGLLAGLQLTFQGILHVGDWVSIPSHNMRGQVQEITITVVKIRTLDDTVSIIPTSILLKSTIINHQDKVIDDNRDIKILIFLDVNTITTCSDEFLSKLENLDKQFSSSLDHQNSTNLALFRIYINKYLNQHPLISQHKATFTMNELSPTPSGLPLEVTITHEKMALPNIEDNRAEIIEHLISILPMFNLRMFQYHNANIYNKGE